MVEQSTTRLCKCLLEHCVGVGVHSGASLCSPSGNHPPNRATRAIRAVKEEHHIADDVRCAAVSTGSRLSVLDIPLDHPRAELASELWPQVVAADPRIGS